MGCTHSETIPCNIVVNAKGGLAPVVALVLFQIRQITLCAATCDPFVLCRESIARAQRHDGCYGKPLISVGF